MNTPPKRRACATLAEEFSGLVQLDNKYKARLHPPTCETSEHNRYGILPYRDTAVSVRGHYFNGNYVSLQGEAPRLIATQAPVQASFDLFWVMVWENRASIVVMLCPEEKEASRYWPRQGCERKVAADLCLQHCGEYEEGSYRVRKFKLRGSSDQLFVVHVQWTGWPDHGIPDRLLHPELAQLLVLVRSYYDRKECCVVHCSAGVGRTGTFLALLHRYISPKSRALEVVKNLRYWRSGMVQTFEQYNLLSNFSVERACPQA